MPIDLTQLTLFIMFVDIIAYFIVGIFLIVRSVQTKQHNVTWYAIEIFFLATFFIIAGAYSKQTQAVDIFLIIAYLCSMLTTFCGLAFVKTTFYKEKESPFKIFLLIGIICTGVIFVLYILLALSLITFSLFENIGDIIFASYYILMFVWLAIVSYDEYKRVKPFNIEPHVKWRYYILSVTSIAGAVGLGSMIVATIFNFGPEMVLLYAMAFLITSIISLVRTGCNYLIWVMPGPFKRFLNKGFTKIDESKELSEEEIMKQMGE